MRTLFALFMLLLLTATAQAADLPGAWVQLGPGGGLDVRAIVPPGGACPAIKADATAVTMQPRGQPDPAGGAYPIQVCQAHLARVPAQLTVGGLPAPVVPKQVNRIVLIGDTGCRLKGDAVQNCNDPADWPFATVARLAALRQPDLVIHVGDYHYRETPCPPGNPGCAGSPYGDNWAVWQRDFFDPAAPLLAAAPWVMVRGNHELCSRAGHGWTRLLDPFPLADCADTAAPYGIDIGTLHLLVLDSAAAKDEAADPKTVPLYRSQLQTLLAKAPRHSWLLTHRPVWALVQAPNIPAGTTANATLQAAIRDQVPDALDLVLSGHIHTFMSFDFGPKRPAQLVAGESGDAKDPIAQPLKPGLPIDGVPIRRTFGLSDYGYVVLQRSQVGWTGTVYSVADTILARCYQRERSLTCNAAPP